MMNLQKNRSQISRVNNAQSQIFENQIIMACMGYINEKRAYIEKTPEPFRVISKNHTTGVFTGRFIKYKNAQPDFKGTIFGGSAICFEAKQTMKDKIKISVLTDSLHRLNPPAAEKILLKQPSCSKLREFKKELPKQLLSFRYYLLFLPRSGSAFWQNH